METFAMEEAKPFTASNSKDASSASSIFYQLSELMAQVRQELQEQAWSLPEWEYRLPPPSQAMWVTLPLLHTDKSLPFSRGSSITNICQTALSFPEKPWFP